MTSLFSDGGYALVPVEATTEMAVAGNTYEHRNNERAIYNSMLSARPTLALEAAVDRYIRAGVSLIEYLDDEPPKKYPFGSYPSIEKELRDSHAELQKLLVSAMSVNPRHMTAPTGATIDGQLRLARKALETARPIIAEIVNAMEPVRNANPHKERAKRALEIIDRALAGGTSGDV